MSPEFTAYLTDKCEVQNRDVTGGKAVFAREVIEPGELIGVWSGRIVTAEELDELPEDIRRHTVQVEEGIYLASLSATRRRTSSTIPASRMRGLDGQVAIVALHRILPGEEVTIDYAMCDGSPYDEFDCECGSSLCRGRVTGEDWRSPALWERYAGHFSPYLARRIEALRRVRAPRRHKRKLMLAASQAQGGA